MEIERRYEVTTANGDIHAFPSLKTRSLFIENNPQLFEIPLLEEDVINKPSHYHKGGIDVLAFVKGKLKNEKLKGFHQINVLKYVTRYEEKGGLEDLKKADFYLKKLIQLEEEEQHAMVSN